MFTVCVPSDRFPHLANSACSRQVAFCPSIVISKSSKFGVRISVRFAIASEFKSMLVSTSAMLPSIMIVVSELVMLFVAYTAGSNSSTTTQSCFMLFHCYVLHIKRFTIKIFIYLSLWAVGMHKWLLLALLLVTSVSAALCSDTDGGGSKHSDTDAFKNKGEVKYGITSQFDTCLTSETGVSTNSSKWLKEYFCQDDTRNSDVYDCSKNGFEKCEDGECVGGSPSSSSSSNQSNQTQQPVSSCGDKITEKSKGEQCDPPGSICFGTSTSEYGSCQADCTCKIAAAALKSKEEQSPVCGDGYKHGVEDCEEDSDCSSSYVCSSCKCVKQLTPEEIEAMKKGAVVEKEEVEEAEELPGVDLTPKNFSEEPGMKTTSSIANFFRKIFGWIGSLFS